MRHVDVVVAGGGPAGSTCASALARAGAHVVVIDVARFPRDKLCAGWITPRVLEVLGLAPEEYRSHGLVMQEMTGFRTSVLPQPRAVSTVYESVVSYGVRRCEFDRFLLDRAGVDVLDGTAVSALRRVQGRWIVNDHVSATMLVGAGGQFCPVARHLNPPSRDGLVIAREIELPLNGDRCSIEGHLPELYFCRDLDGYGWCVRKGDFLNVGFGRRTARDFQRHVREFVGWLSAWRSVPERVLDAARWRGHAYRLRGVTPHVAGENVLLIGDAAGLAWPESGEGIAPAVESGAIAARTIVAARGHFAASEAPAYASAIGATTKPGLSVPAPFARTLLRVPAFARYALDRWFLRVNGHPALAPVPLWHNQNASM
jgi:geranylgeranyl reductase family protein